MTNTAIILLAADFRIAWVVSINYCCLLMVSLCYVAAEMLASLPHVSVNVVLGHDSQKTVKLLRVLTLPSPSIQTMQRA